MQSVRGKGSMMDILRANKPIQYIIVLLPLLLIFIYIFVFLQDLSLVYGNAKVNQDLMKGDKSVVKLIEYSELDDGKFKAVEVGGIEHTLDNPEIVTALSDGKDSKNLAYYSKDSNAIIQPVGDDFAKNFLTGSNFYTLIFSVIPMIALLGLAVYDKAFVVLSKKRYFVVYTIITLLLFSLYALVVSLF